MGVLCSTRKKQFAQNTDEDLLGDVDLSDREGS
jgi:hypothetical protein